MELERRTTPGLSIYNGALTIYTEVIIHMNVRIIKDSLCEIQKGRSLLDAINAEASQQ